MFRILTLNGGSSSIRFTVHESGGGLKPCLEGKLDRIGSPDATLAFRNPADNRQHTRRLDLADRQSTVDFLMGWLEAQEVFASVGAIGHRVVHGMEHTGPELITPELLAGLRDISPYSPEHLPLEIKLMEIFLRRHPGLPQVACFDTAFHRDMPRMAKLLPIPRRYAAKGVRRYGFHGLSYSYLMEELERLGGRAEARGRVILAHLGNGASMAAVSGGACLDTSMGFTPAAGLVMGTRSGDLDPGLISFLARTEKMTAAQFHQMVNHDSGLIGVSETTSDMRELLARESADVRAGEAVGLFCYQAKKWIGSLTAVLGGLDTLVFAGGIGENCPSIRTRICDGLGFLGLELDETGNLAGADVISPPDARVMVRMIGTDEALMIARSVCRLIIAGGGRMDEYQINTAL
ncbi:MAG: acetate kinase [Verrucomicrobiales bacterium]|nr:acetate kinase [Verrucomicrobiales bacterium]